MGAGAVFLLWALNSNDWSGVSLAYGWSEGAFQPYQAARLLEVLEGQQSLVNRAIWAVVVGLATGAALSMVIQRRMRAWDSAKAIQPGVNVYLTLFAGFVIVTGVMYVVVFFATGPAFIAHPQHFFSEMGFQFRYQVLGSSYGELGKPGLVNFIKAFGGQFHAGWLAFVPLLGYAAYINIRSSTSSPVQRDQRLVLWGFILITLVLFFGSHSATSLRHILPIVGILYVFMAEAIVLEFRRWQYSRAAVGMALVLSMFMLVGFGGHAREAYGNWDYLRFKPQDTGVQVGNWLQEQYPEDTRLMTDFIQFYIPPYFTHSANTTTAEYDRFRGADKDQAVINWIVSFDPEVLVISHPQQYGDFVKVPPLLDSDPVLKNRNYRLVKEFEYQRPDRQRYGYENIQVYDRSAPKTGGHFELQESSSVSSDLSEMKNTLEFWGAHR